MAACSLEVVAYYSSCSSSYSSDCFDYSGYLSNPGPDSNSDFDSGICSDMYYLHIVLTIIDFADSHTVLTLLSSVLTEVLGCFCSYSYLVNCATWFTKLLRTSVSAPTKGFLGADVSRGH